MATSRKALGWLIVIAMLGCSCVGRREVVRAPQAQPVTLELTETESALGRKWILSAISDKLKEVLREPVVHAVADKALRLYHDTWGEERPQVDIFFSDYAVRLPVGEIAGYPWASVEQQLKTGHPGPVLLKNGWQVWLGYIERADAISHDLSISVRETCSRLAISEDAKRDRAVGRLCERFRKGFVFASDLELFRRLWHSSFQVEDLTKLTVGEALATLFLGDLKRLMAPPAAAEHVAEVWTPWMKGFEFGDQNSEEGLCADLFDQRNHVTVIFLPPAPLGERLDEEFRKKALACVRRHGQWTPGLEMIRQAESILQLPDLDNKSEVSMVLLFSALQFADHKTRAARMLLKLFPEGAPEREEIAKIIEEML